MGTASIENLQINPSYPERTTSPSGNDPIDLDLDEPESPKENAMNKLLEQQKIQEILYNWVVKRTLGKYMGPFANFWGTSQEANGESGDGGQKDTTV